MNEQTRPFIDATLYLRPCLVRKRMSLTVRITSKQNDEQARHRDFETIAKQF
jgi:hypothetical protein